MIVTAYLGPEGAVQHPERLAGELGPLLDQLPTAAKRLREATEGEGA